MSSNEASYYVLIDDEFKRERDALLSVTLTEEGIICDLILNGEVIQSWARTGQEFVDFLLPFE